MKTYSKYILLLIPIALLALIKYWPNQEVDVFLNMSHQELLNLPKKDRPDLAALHDYKVTLDPALGYPPRERLFDAQRFTNDLLTIKKNARAIDNVLWIERGPNNVAGRTRAIMFDPNDSEYEKVWAGSVGGGLWTIDDITDPNAEWSAIDDFLPNLAISTLAYDPSNTSVFYLGTGEGWGNIGAVRGAGIWISIDAGDTWARLGSTESGFEYIQKIIVTNESTVLAAVRSSSSSNDSGIFRSEDNGETWEVVLDGDYGVDIERTEDNLYASTMDGKLYKSTDDGENWVDITPENGADRIEIGVTEHFSNYIYAVGNDGVDAEWIYSSINGGESWTEVTVPNYFETNCSVSNDAFTRQQGWYDLIIAVSPSNPNTVILGGIDLYKSEDGGENWDLISYWTGDCANYVHADQHNFLFRPNHEYEAISSNDGGLYLATNLDDQTPDFEARNNNYNVTQFYGCAMVNEPLSNVFLAGAQDNGSHLYSDFGINATREVTGGDGVSCFIDQNDQNIMITSHVYNNYFISTDGMSTFSGFGIGSESGQFINPSIYDTRTQSLFAGANTNQINIYTNLTSGNVTERTRSIDLNNREISAIVPSLENSDNIIVGTYGGEVFFVEDVFGTSPTTSLIGDFTGSISSIAIGASDDQLLVTISNYGVTSVYETRDGGNMWDSKEGNLPDMPIRWGLYNPNNTDEVLLATELGVWSIDDISVDDVEWEPSNDGLANVVCYMLRYRDSDGLVAVATHGRGLFTTDIFAVKAIAGFSTEAPLSYVGNALSFVNQSLKSTSYDWDFGDGNSSSIENPTHTYDSEGTYTVSLTINDDVDNIVTKDVVILPFLPADFRLNDGGNFESNENYFTSLSVSGTTFELGTSSVSGKSGTESGSNAWVTGLNSSLYEPWSESYLYTPAFDFSLSGIYTMSFHTKYEIEDEWDGFIIEYSYDGEEWLKLIGDVGENWYNQNAVNGAIVFESNEAIFSGDTDGEYIEKSIDLTSLSNNDLVAFRFVFLTDGFVEEAGIAIDDFEISGPSDSSPVLSFVVSDNTCINDEVTFSNESSGMILSYTWDFGEDATPETAEGFGPFDVVYSSSGSKTVLLTAATESGDITESIDLEVSDLPIDKITLSPEFICTSQDLIIEIEDSEAGVDYVIIDLATNDIVSEAITGSGSNVDVIIEGGINSSSIFKIQATNDKGCSFLLSDIIEVAYVEFPEITISEGNNGTLIASFIDGDSYTWYLNGVEIEGATEAEYIPMIYGNYEVEIVSGQCVLQSSSAYTVLDIEDELPSITVFPNPVANILNISGVAIGSGISVLDLTGKILISTQLDSPNAIELDLTNFDSGVYLVRVGEGSQVVTRRIVKQ